MTVQNKITVPINFTLPINFNLVGLKLKLNVLSYNLYVYGVPEGRVRWVKKVRDGH